MPQNLLIFFFGNDDHLNVWVSSMCGKKQNKSSSSVLPACNKSRARKYIGAIFKQERSQILEPFLFIHLIMF